MRDRLQLFLYFCREIINVTKLENDDVFRNSDVIVSENWYENLVDYLFMC